MFVKAEKSIMRETRTDAQQFSIWNFLISLSLFWNFYEFYEYIKRRDEVIHPPALSVSLKLYIFKKFSIIQNFSDASETSETSLNRQLIKSSLKALQNQMLGKSFLF